MTIEQYILGFITGMILFYYITIELNIYIQLFIDAYILFGGLGILHMSFWKTNNPLTDVLILALIGYGIITATKNAGEIFIQIREDKMEEKKKCKTK